MVGYTDLMEVERILKNKYPNISIYNGDSGRDAVAQEEIEMEDDNGMIYYLILE